jgi:hypothetical protein
VYGDAGLCLIPGDAKEGREMTRCEQCGNEYDKSFQVVFQGRARTFDCFECAIQSLAPTCRHCGCKIVGHGVEAEGNFYCCASCARLHGVAGLRDRLDATISVP